MKFSTFYTILIIAELVAILLNWHTAEYFTKPALVISLIFYLVSFQQSAISFQLSNIIGVKLKNQNLYLLLALVFCLAGDIILIFPNGFIFGLAAFLLGHIFYILTFLKDNDGFHLKKNRLWLFVLGAFIFGLILLTILIPRVDNALKIPIFVYACTILTMLITVFNRFKISVSKISYNQVLLGAGLFVISDACLAVNEFVQPFAFARFFIMLTYGVAQYFIVVGYKRSIKIIE